MTQPLQGLVIGYAVLAGIFVIISLICLVVSYVEHYGDAQRRKVEDSVIGVCAGLLWPVTLALLVGWGLKLGMRRLREFA